MTQGLLTAIIFPSYLCTGNPTPLRSLLPRDIFRSTTILYSPLRELQFIHHTFQNNSLSNQRQTVGNLAHFVTPECLISFIDFFKILLLFCLDSAILLLNTIFYLKTKQNDCVPHPVMTAQSSVDQPPAKLVKIIF